MELHDTPASNMPDRHTHALWRAPSPLFCIQCQCVSHTQWGTPRHAQTWTVCGVPGKTTTESCAQSRWGEGCCSLGRGCRRRGRSFRCHVLPHCRPWRLRLRNKNPLLSSRSNTCSIPFGARDMAGRGKGEGGCGWCCGGHGSLYALRVTFECCVSALVYGQ
jgi:hypothetical protein